MFKKGDFIKQKSVDVKSMFAIFQGIQFESDNEGEGPEYSLSCYYNNEQYVQNSEGKWEKVPVYTYDLGDEELCEYVIAAEDLDEWVLCTQFEKEYILKFLATTKRIAWNESSCTFRKMLTSESITYFKQDANVNPAARGTYYHPGSTYTNPYHNSSNTHSSSSQKAKLKVISLKVSEDWEQKKPVEPIDLARKVSIMSVCNKIKPYEFYSRSYNRTGYHNPYYYDEEYMDEYGYLRYGCYE